MPDDGSNTSAIGTIINIIKTNTKDKINKKNVRKKDSKAQPIWNYISLINWRVTCWLVCHEYINSYLSNRLQNVSNRSNRQNEWSEFEMT